MEETKVYPKLENPDNDEHVQSIIDTYDKYVKENYPFGIEMTRALYDHRMNYRKKMKKLERQSVIISYIIKSVTVICIGCIGYAIWRTLA